VTERPFFEFADDNTFVNKRWGREFVKALTPLGIRWFTETDVSIADDDELLALLAPSGCRQVLIGFEDPHEDALAGIDRSGFKKKRAAHYLEAIDKIQSHGVSVNGCFIVGLDTHTPDVFEKLKAFIDRSGLLEVQITVMTPFPGTPLHDRLRREGRLLKDRYWDRCTLFDVNYVPKRMTVRQLEEGLMYLFREVYNESEFVKRQRRYMEIVKEREA
jgi:radical SAM superfamily enzyme YgiQ (UPF0313 family)